MNMPTARCPECGKVRLIGGTHSGKSVLPCYGLKTKHVDDEAERSFMRGALYASDPLAMVRKLIEDLGEEAEQSFKAAFITEKPKIVSDSKVAYEQWLFDPTVGAAPFF